MREKGRKKKVKRGKHGEREMERERGKDGYIVGCWVSVVEEFNS